MIFKGRELLGIDIPRRWILTVWKFKLIILNVSFQYAVFQKIPQSSELYSSKLETTKFLALD